MHERARTHAHRHGPNAHTMMPDVFTCAHTPTCQPQCSQSYLHTCPCTVYTCVKTSLQGQCQVSARIYITCEHNPITCLPPMGTHTSVSPRGGPPCRPSGQGPVPPVPSAALTDHTTPGLRGLPRKHSRSPPLGWGHGPGCNVGTRERQLLADGCAGRQAGA